VLQRRIRSDFGIDVEEHGHIHLLVRIQLLFLEAEALDLVEIGARLKGDHIVRADADYRLIRGVPGRVEIK